MKPEREHNLGRCLEREAGARPFLVVAELVPGPGHDLRPIEDFLESYERGNGFFPDDVRLAAVALPQSPGGVASLSPADIVAAVDAGRGWAGLDILAHVSAKDHNAEALRAYLAGLERLGVESVLAVTGDQPAAGRGVFDLDAIGLLRLVQDVNVDSLQRAAPGGYDAVHQFFALAAMSPFKYTEASVRQQYLKAAKKVRSGARGLIGQLGWDWRKSAELFRALADEGVDVPVLGNVFVLSTATSAPRLMAEGKLPGCVVTPELFQKVVREKLGDHLERAAQQVAMYRDLGAAGVDIGGLWGFAPLVTILERAREIGPGWVAFKDNLDFAPKALADGRPPYFLYGDDGVRKEPSRPRPTLNKRTFDILHRTLLTPGRALNPAFKAVLGGSASLRRGRGLPYKAFFASEAAAKAFLYECEECGDCFLPENFGRCTMGECEKGLANPPCGDARPDGTCGHNDSRRCVGELIYEAAASEGQAGLDRLARTILPPRNAALQGTSSVLNYLFEKDHAGAAGLIMIGEVIHASIPKTAAAMAELLALGPGALEKPSGALRYLVSLIEAQIRHGAAYIDLNVDAFGDNAPGQGTAMMRDYVRLVRRHGRGIPVSIDSGSTDVLRAGLEAWYEEGTTGLEPPLLNSVKTYTMDELLPLRNRYPFRFIGLLVDDKTGGRDGVYSVEELHALARVLLRAAVDRYGFAPSD
ncbi:MAG: methylenetetrahydrofolate reductase C-terminal domain-containing protein, partial [Candidatus Aminicenantes bacterium]|nr:methylenetetrahydrofolate reductase C-terminal domain-containing protein [Candidatus Aminicenantes bacterium]